jgi:hypothetical protein
MILFIFLIELAKLLGGIGALVGGIYLARTTFKEAKVTDYPLTPCKTPTPSLR